MGRRAIAAAAAIVSIVGVGAALTGPLGGAPASAKARVQFSTSPSDTPTSTVPATTLPCASTGAYGWGNVLVAPGQTYGWGNSARQAAPTTTAPAAAVAVQPKGWGNYARTTSYGWGNSMAPADCKPVQ